MNPLATILAAYEAIYGANWAAIDRNAVRGDDPDLDLYVSPDDETHMDHAYEDRMRRGGLW